MPHPVSDAASHLKALIACRSVTPDDGGAQAYLAETLAAAGFTVERLTFSAPDTPEVANLFATIGTGAPHLAFNGHSDVVPPGDEARWSHPPFAAETDRGAIFGRGAVDMKGGIAAFLAAALGFVGSGPFRGTLSFLITGDEEGPAVNGTVKLVRWALDHGHRFDAALVGEPTSQRQLGDTIKTGRRGSLSGTIVVEGRQGHVAYPHLADNPVPRLVGFLDRLTRMKLDDGSADFDPSNLEVTGVTTDNHAFNVIPGAATARFNVRFNDFWSSTSIKALIRRELAEVGDCEIVYEPASEPFLTKSPELVGALSRAIQAVTGIVPRPSTGGGTSDARFFADVCPVVEFGLVGRTMHQTDEHVPLAELDDLTAIYGDFLQRFFAASR